MRTEGESTLMDSSARPENASECLWLNKGGSIFRLDHADAGSQIISDVVKVGIVFVVDSAPVWSFM